MEFFFFKSRNLNHNEAEKKQKIRAIKSRIVKSRKEQKIYTKIKIFSRKRLRQQTKHTIYQIGNNMLFGF